MADKYSMKDLKDCAKRELNMRRALYPGWVENRRMKPELAKSEIEKMQAIVDHFAALEEKERLL